MLAIVDYNAGNLRSVQRACAAVGLQAEFTADPEVVAKADRIIFPGVGHAKTCMETLTESGLGAAIVDAFARGTPILGICVGAQLLLSGSEEGPTAGLGLIAGTTRRFRLADPALKIPHIGWNEVRPSRPHPLLEHVAPGDEFYFVHAYFPDPSEPSQRYAIADHGDSFCCALGRGNLFATQFHPEKSGRLGLALLERFSRWDGTPC
jgi:glutamine amidotransferase